MEVVSLDAYDWVMYSNIASMGYYTKAPYHFMQKPYLSTSAYIRRMSDYKDIEPLWDALFYAWIVRNEKHLEGGAKAYLRNLVAFKRFPREKQDLILATALSLRTKTK